ncbi:hypothetical protein AALA24_03270 [Anaerovoracaceae bacterium 42-11]
MEVFRSIFTFVWYILVAAGAIIVGCMAFLFEMLKAIIECRRKVKAEERGETYTPKQPVSKPKTQSSSQQFPREIFVPVKRKKKSHGFLYGFLFGFGRGMKDWFK